MNQDISRDQRGGDGVTSSGSSSSFTSQQQQRLSRVSFTATVPSSSSSSSSTSTTTGYKKKYKNLKKKLKLLVYEQETLRDELGKTQTRLIQASKDKNFLLDRLLQYEDVDDSDGDSEASVSSAADSEREDAVTQQQRQRPRKPRQPPSKRRTNSPRQKDDKIFNGQPPLAKTRADGDRVDFDVASNVVASAGTVKLPVAPATIPTPSRSVSSPVRGTFSILPSSSIPSSPNAHPVVVGLDGPPTTSAVDPPSSLKLVSSLKRRIGAPAVVAGISIADGTSSASTSAMPVVAAVSVATHYQPAPSSKLSMAQVVSGLVQNTRNALSEPNVVSTTVPGLSVSPVKRLSAISTGATSTAFTSPPIQTTANFLQNIQVLIQPKRKTSSSSSSSSPCTAQVPNQTPAVTQLLKQIQLQQLLQSQMRQQREAVGLRETPMPQSVSRVTVPTPATTSTVTTMSKATDVVSGVSVANAADAVVEASANKKPKCDAVDTVSDILAAKQKQGRKPQQKISAMFKINPTVVSTRNQDSTGSSVATVTPPVSQRSNHSASSIPSAIIGPSLESSAVPQTIHLKESIIHQLRNLKDKQHLQQILRKVPQLNQSLTTSGFVASSSEPSSESSVRICLVAPNVTSASSFTSTDTTIVSSQPSLPNVIDELTSKTITSCHVVAQSPRQSPLHVSTPHVQRPAVTDAPVSTVAGESLRILSPRFPLGSTATLIGSFNAQLPGNVMRAPGSIALSSVVPFGGSVQNSPIAPLLSQMTARSAQPVASVKQFQSHVGQRQKVTTANSGPMTVANVVQLIPAESLVTTAGLTTTVSSSHPITTTALCGVTTFIESTSPCTNMAQNAPGTLASTSPVTTVQAEASAAVASPFGAQIDARSVIFTQNSVDGRQLHRVSVDEPSAMDTNVAVDSGSNSVSSATISVADENSYDQQQINQLWQSLQADLFSPSETLSNSTQQHSFVSHQLEMLRESLEMHEPAVVEPQSTQLLNQQQFTDGCVSSCQLQPCSIVSTPLDGSNTQNPIQEVNSQRPPSQNGPMCGFSTVQVASFPQVLNTQPQIQINQPPPPMNPSQPPIDPLAEHSLTIPLQKNVSQQKMQPQTLLVTSQGSQGTQQYTLPQPKQLQLLQQHEQHQTQRPQPDQPSLQHLNISSETQLHLRQLQSQQNSQLLPQSSPHQLVFPQPQQLQIMSQIQQPQLLHIPQQSKLQQQHQPQPQQTQPQQPQHQQAKTQHQPPQSQHQQQQPQSQPQQQQPQSQPQQQPPQSQPQQQPPQSQPQQQQPQSQPQQQQPQPLPQQLHPQSLPQQQQPQSQPQQQQPQQQQPQQQQPQQQQPQQQQPQSQPQQQQPQSQQLQTQQQNQPQSLQLSQSQQPRQLQQILAPQKPQQQNLQLLQSQQQLILQPQLLLQQPFQLVQQSYQILQQPQQLAQPFRPQPPPQLTLLQQPQLTTQHHVLPQLNQQAAQQQRRLTLASPQKVPPSDSTTVSSSSASSSSSNASWNRGLNQRDRNQGLLGHRVPVTLPKDIFDADDDHDHDDGDDNAGENRVGMKNASASD